MITIPGIEKKKIGVYGLGATSLSACEALAAYFIHRGKEHDPTLIYDLS